MRLLLGLFVAAGLSLLVGLAASHMAASMPCQGEGLACNLNEAIGGYAVLIWSCLGPLVFGVILLVARNRTALVGGMVLLFAPLVLFMVGNFIEAWTTIGFEPYRNSRTFLTMFVPPQLVVLTQWKLLSALIVRKEEQIAGVGMRTGSETSERPPLLTE